jgi:hypothetical protein
MKRIDAALAIARRIKKGKLHHQYRCDASKLNWAPRDVLKPLGDDLVQFDAECGIILELLKKHKLPFNQSGSKCIMTKETSLTVQYHCSMECIKFKKQSVGSIPADEWGEFIKKYDPKWNNYTIRDDVGTGALELSSRFKIPACCLKCIVWSDRTEVTLSGKIFLIDAYQAIYDASPHNWNVMEDLVFKVDMAYSYANQRFLFEKNDLKVDYQLVILQNYRQFARLHHFPHIDFTQDNLPDYWFDSIDFSATTLDELMDKLAIEEKWHFTPAKDGYIVTCGFPAGAIFLRTTIERQETKQGGGIEYIYIHNLEKEQVKEVSGKPCKNLTELDIRFANLCLQ